MKTSTLLTFLIPILFLLLMPFGRAKAQTVAVCEYADECIFVAYEAVQESAPNAGTLLVVLNATLLNSGNCSNIDGMIFVPVGGVPVLRTRAQLAASPFVELLVNRDLFVSTPDVVVSTFTYLQFFGFRIPIPTEIVDLQARLDSNDPCLSITPLPVELISFSGVASANGVALQWSTASEENNSHFEVERSADGKQFEQIGSVQGHGTSSVMQRYRHLDSRPLPGQNYYRLKQVDYDGQFEYSKVIAVATAEGLAKQLQIMLSPNPCRNGDCNVSLIVPYQQREVLVQLQDLSGRVLFEQNLAGEDAELQLSQQQLQNLRGMFILSAKSGQEVVRQRVVLE
ncbi:hypothetical protein [Pontibacter actiniarum]|uniref:T9SS C-terminal target domain-containing protein n=1 Tax=Pontibacter actiniarum TaxID=323450 RepID=A0A1X9YUT9_9BACT|nr:hypothetical protein [Pontibacter actiniarum]ARS36602.1 hypothetical protein CA264_14905 [Pontibacter actiniarum]